MLFVGYPKCSTCKKAQKWPDESRAEYTLRDIKMDNPTAEELKAWWEKSGHPLKRPILVAEDKILVGAREKEWKEYLKL